VNDLRERLDHLADAAADGIELTRPDQRHADRPRRRSGPLVVAVVALVIITAATAVVLVVRADGDNDVAVGGRSDDGGGSAGPGNDAVVAVTYGDASLSREPVDLRLRFLDTDGSVIAERSWSEVERPTEGAPGEVVVMGGLLQRVPVGELRLEATLRRAGEPVSCTQPFTAPAGDRLILRLQPGSIDEADCAQIRSVDDWVANRTGRPGGDYIGLSHAEADERAREAGLTTRVVGADGMDLAVTMDLRLDRLNLMLFDDIVVAAQLDAELAVPDELECPADSSCSTRTVVIPPSPVGHGTLAVDLEPVDGVPPSEGVTVTLQVYDSRGALVAEPDWSRSVSGQELFTSVAAGRMRLVSFVRSASAPDGQHCETPIDVPDGDSTRVTLLLSEDEWGACASVAAASFEADHLLGMRGLPAPGFVGLTEGEAIDKAAARGWTVRVLARDGEGETRTADYRPERVNLVLEGGRVAAAARS
jgi:hypothetical protein